MSKIVPTAARKQFEIDAKKLIDADKKANIKTTSLFFLELLSDGAQFIGNIPVYKTDIDRLSTDTKIKGPQKHLNDEMVEYAIYFLFLSILLTTSTSLSTVMKLPWKVLNPHFWQQLTQNTKLSEHNFFDSYSLVPNFFKKSNLLALEWVAAPICYGGHWSIVFIIRPNAILPTTKSSSSKNSVGCTLIHVDSLGNYHDTEKIAENLRHHMMLHFLDDRNSMVRDQHNEQVIRRTIAKIPVFKPRPSIQENYFDCGIYVGLFFQRFMMAYLETKKGE